MLQEFAHCASDAVVITLLPDCCTADCPELIIWSGEGKIEKPSSIFKIRRVSDRKSVGLSLSQILSCVFDPTGRFGRCPRNFYYFKPSTAKN